MAYINGKEILFSPVISGVSETKYAEVEAEKEKLNADLTVMLQNGEDGVIAIPDSITKLRSYAFYRHTTITGIILPEKLTQIMDAALYGCEALLRVIVKSSVLNAIGKQAFYNCTSCLEYDFTACKSVPTLVNTNAFTGINENAIIKVPPNLYTEWKAATNWATFASYIVADVKKLVVPQTEGTVTTWLLVNTRETLNFTLGFYIPQDFTFGKQYISRTWTDESGEHTDEYEFSSDVKDASGTTLLEWSANIIKDTYNEAGFTLYGEYYSDVMMIFYRTGTYKIYQKYIDTEGNEFTTGSYIFEVG